MPSVNDGQISLVGKSQFNNVQWDIKNKSTNVAGKIFGALVVIAALGAVATFAAHGGIATIGSDALVFGGGAAGAAGLVYGGMKIRDWREKKHAEIEWQKKEKATFEEDLSKLRKNGMELTQEINMKNKSDKQEKYFLTAKKGGSGVKISKLPPK